MALRLAGIGSPEEKIGQLSQENVSSSANTVSFRANVTGYSGIVTGDSGLSRKIGHLQSESAVTFGRNNRSRSNGISGQIGAEYAQATVPKRVSTPLERFEPIEPLRRAHECREPVSEPTVQLHAMPINQVYGSELCLHTDQNKHSKALDNKKY